MDKDRESLVRQDFEEHIKSIYEGHLVSLDKEYGYYKSDMVEHMWLGWKAAHSKYHISIPIKLPVVEIPYSWEEYEAGCTVVDLEHMLEALDEAGVKYK